MHLQESGVTSLVLLWGTQKLNGWRKNFSARSTWDSQLGLCQAQGKLPDVQAEPEGKPGRMLPPPSWGFAGWLEGSLRLFCQSMVLLTWCEVEYRQRGEREAVSRGCFNLLFYTSILEKVGIALWRCPSLNLDYKRGLDDGFELDTLCFHGWT